MIETI